MKRLAIILCCILLFTPCINARRMAIVVAISDYQDSGWSHINANNDVVRIKEALKDFNSIQIISEHNATFYNVTQTLSNQNINSGDTLCVFFSCHGQQVYNPDGEENDSLDESLVMYDAGRHASSSYSGEHHLTDNYLSVIINKWRKTAGANGLVIVISDACHSGDMHKASKKDHSRISRGVNDAFGAESLSEVELSSLRAAGIDNGNFTIPKEHGLSDVAYISACKSNENNYEIQVDGTNCGALVYSTTQAYIRVGLQNLDSFLNYSIKLMSEYQPLQTPVVQTTVAFTPEEDHDVADSISQEIKSNGFDTLVFILGGILILLIVILGIVIYGNRYSR